MTKLSLWSVATASTGLALVLVGCAGSGSGGQGIVTATTLSPGSIEYSMGSASLTVHQGTDSTSPYHLQPSSDDHPLAVPGAAFVCGASGDFTHSSALLAVNAPARPGKDGYVVVRIEPDGARILQETTVSPSGRVTAYLSQPGKYSILKKLPSGGVYWSKKVAGHDLTLIAGSIGDFVARYKNQSLVGKIDESGDFIAMNDLYAVTGRAKLVGGAWELSGQLSQTGLTGSTSFLAPPPDLKYEIKNGPAAGSQQLIDATPQMPDIRATAEQTGGDKVDCGKVTFQWELKLTHKPTELGDTNAPNITLYADYVRETATGQSFMLANRSATLRGGKAKLTVKVKFEGVDLANQPKALEFQVLGTSPSGAEVDAAANDETLSKIFAHETKQYGGKQQFRNGKPIWSSDGEKGLGISQYTPRPAGTPVNPAHAWDWRANVEAGRGILSGTRSTSAKMAANAKIDPSSATWATWVQKFNDEVRTPAGLPHLTAISAPDWTADMIERNAVRGYNGWKGSHFMFTTRQLPEWTVLNANRTQIDVDLGPNPATATTGTARWRKVLGSERPSGGNPNYTDDVLGQ